MKKQMILGSLLALSQITSAQNNVFPTPSGNVGIGTTTPAAKLDVLSTTNQLRLSNSSTFYSDINSTTNGLIFSPSSTANKVAFGIAAPAAGNGFHSNMGRFLMTDQAAPWPRGIIFQPNQTAGGDMPAGAAITSGITAANPGEGLSLVTCAYGYNGVKLGAYAYSTYGWKSMWETQNVVGLHNYPNLLLVKNSGNVGIGTGAIDPQSHLDIANSQLGTTAGNKINWMQMSGSTGSNGEYLKTYHNRYANGNDWTSSEIRIQKVIDVTNHHYISFRGSSTQSSLNFGFGSNDLMSILDNGQVAIGAKKLTSGPHATDAKLTVDGKIVSTSMYVTQLNWADFVFEKDYKLPKLSEIESYYKENGHLPLIPSEKEVKENGIDLGEMNKLLLQKIEELTILMVEQDKRIKNLENK